MPEPRPEDRLLTPIHRVKGVGETRAAQLARLGIETVRDLLWTLPRRYEDRRHFVSIRDLRPGETTTLRGAIAACGWVQPRFGKSFFEARLTDGTGVAIGRWFGAHYLEGQLQKDDRLIVYGKAIRHRGQWIVQHPEFEREEGGTEESLHMNRIVPIYPLTEELTQRVVRRLVWTALEQFAPLAEESLPSAVRERHQLVALANALPWAHFPPDLDAAGRARYRLVFEEFLGIQLVLAARKSRHERKNKGMVHAAPGLLAERFTKILPFQLTGGQRAVLEEIRRDMHAERPMHRLLQGDVGSGKTVVAVCAMLDAIECGSQAAVMAPTEVLAGQHAHTLAGYLSPLGLRPALLTSEVKGVQRQRLLEGLRAGEVPLAVGTHALIQEGVQFHRLGLIVIDEQHKFGVEQRAELYGKGERPDVLVMTATPIPRTLAMTVYGDLDISALREMPAGRGRIVTRVIKARQLPDAYGFIRKQAEKGRQTYIIYPVISESENSDLRAASAMYEKLRDETLKGLRLGLVHGQMPSSEKESAMATFRAGQLDVLVATTVVEVGIDVPNANVMLVEHAERFGLAQLHQLRGRVARGQHKAFCILQGDAMTPEAWRRLKVMEETTDGFRIAEEDLRIRGMGNLLGREQSGLPPFRVGDPVADVEVLREARSEAFALLEADPGLALAEHRGLRAAVCRLYKQGDIFVDIG